MSLKTRLIFNLFLQVLILLLIAGAAHAWYGKTHFAIAKRAGYRYWYNAAAADIARLKAGDIEKYNHFVNNRKGAKITPDMVLAQIKKYDSPRDRKGHLYGAIVGSIRGYIKAKREGKFAEDHMAFCVHYIGDLSMPLHNIEYTPFNKRYHLDMDGILEQKVLDNLFEIKMEKITIKTENDLIKEICRIASISMELGFRLEKEERMMTKAEAYRQISMSASLLKAVIEYADYKTHR
ncbi:MAG: hypothetical protein GX654_11860 [Desulfatiglans sp.]|jgi:hypothetical protein|nr:hypothetical protein [Desulfatiglans sp.]